MNMRHSAKIDDLHGFGSYAGVLMAQDTWK